MPKKPDHSNIIVSDVVVKNVLMVLITKIHERLKTLEQTTGYVPFFQTTSTANRLVWTDFRKRGRSTYGEYPTITFTLRGDGTTTTYVWWNRHFGERAEVIAAPEMTLEVIQQIEDTFNAEMDNITALLSGLNEQTTLNGVKNE